VFPQFFGRNDHPDALAAIRAWTRRLFPALDEQDAHIRQGQLGQLTVPVTLIFGAGDAYLSPQLAADLADLFSHATVHLVTDASHWPQWDQPAAVAKLIKAATT